MTVTRRYAGPSPQPRRHWEHTGDGHEQESAPGHQARRRYRRTARPKAASCMKQDGGASGAGGATLAKPQGDQKLKAILKSHQTVRDLSSAVWDTLLTKASSPEEEAMRKQTQSCRGSSPRRTGMHTRHAVRMGVLGHDQVSAGKGKRGGNSNSTEYHVTIHEWRQMPPPKVFGE